MTLFGRLRLLDDERHRKLENLRKEDRDCADAVAWLRNNQDKFKMEVFEPPMISCSVPDKRYTSAVEACFGSTQLKVGLTIGYISAYVPDVDHRCTMRGRLPVAEPLSERYWRSGVEEGR